MATIPDRDEHRRRFASLDGLDRREIVKAVNRGDAVEKRKLAPLAVGIARRQMKFWRYGWLVAPVMGVIQVFFVPLEVVLLNTLVATLTLGAMSLFFYRRASRAESRNLALAAGPGSSGTRRSGQASGFGRHLPGEASKPARGRTTTSADGEDDGPADEAPSTATTSGRKPYKPRGRKRR